MTILVSWQNSEEQNLVTTDGDDPDHKLVARCAQTFTYHHEDLHLASLLSYITITLILSEIHNLPDTQQQEHEGLDAEEKINGGDRRNVSRCRERGRGDERMLCCSPSLPRDRGQRRAKGREERGGSLLTLNLRGCFLRKPESERMKWFWLSRAGDLRIANARAPKFKCYEGASNLRHNQKYFINP